MMKAQCSSERSVLGRSTVRNIPEDGILVVTLSRVDSRPVRKDIYGRFCTGRKVAASWPDEVNQTKQTNSVALSLQANYTEFLLIYLIFFAALDPLTEMSIEAKYNVSGE
jgi:hypothetical protein